MASIPSATDNPVIEGVRCASKRILGLMMSPELGGMIFSFTRGSLSLRFSKTRTTNFVRAMKWFFRKFLALLVLSSFLRAALHIFPSPLAPEISFLDPSLGGKNSFKLVSQDKPISYPTIREAFRRDMRSVGVDPSTFGFHSLGLGGATSAANHGVSDRVFQSHGRWKSVQAKDAYGWWPRKKRLSVSKSLGF